jgi:hypothetical protein
VEEDETVPNNIVPEVAEAEAERNDATAGLSLYKHIPPGMKGEQLLDHMYKFSHRTHRGDAGSYGISSHLGVSPRGAFQRSLCSINPHQEKMKTLMNEMNAGICKSRAMRARMTNMGEIGGQSGIINDDKSNDKAKFRAALLASQAEVIEAVNAKKATKTKAAALDSIELLPMALHHYGSVPEGSSSYPRVFTKKCVEAILSLVLEVTVSGSVKRNDLITMIQHHATKHPSAIHDAMAKHPFEQSKTTSEIATFQSSTPQRRFIIGGIMGGVRI